MRRNQELFRHLKDRAPAHIHDSEWPKSELARLALMQHFGGPTRLLDWTEDPDVAALFAVADADRKTASAVWAIHSAAIKKESERLLSWSPKALTTMRSSSPHFFHRLGPL